MFSNGRAFANDDSSTNFWDSKYPLTTQRANVTSDGTQSQYDIGSTTSALSSDGRYVVFDSYASDLVTGDTNNTWDVFLHDNKTGTTTIVSVASDGTKGNYDSQATSMSADARYIVFQSNATNLVTGDTNSKTDIFLHDMQTGETKRVSVDSNGTQANGASTNYINSTISGDGRYITFASTATNLVTGDTNGKSDIFLHDMQTGTTKMISLADDSTLGNADSVNPVISSDGQHIAYSSSATNLVANDTNGQCDIFEYNLQTGKTIRISVASDGTQADRVSYEASISSDGRYVAFASNATNLVSGDTNEAQDIFVHDLQSGTTIRVSVASDGAQGIGNADYPCISGDGRYVVFDSSANLIANKQNAGVNIYFHDMVTGHTRSITSSDQGNNYSMRPAISQNGEHIAYTSSISNIIAGDTNGKTDLFVTNTVDAATDAYLSDLTISAGSLSPAFGLTTTSYTAIVGSNVDSITMIPTTDMSTASVAVNGTTVSSGSASQPINLSTGTNTITVTVTASDGSTTKTYTITVTRLSTNDDNLIGLRLSQGALSPAFASGTTVYTANVDNHISSLTVTPTTEDTAAIVKVNGAAVTSDSASQEINLSGGTATINIEVTAADGTTIKTYTMTVNAISSLWSPNDAVNITTNLKTAFELQFFYSQFDMTSDERYIVFDSGTSGLVPEDADSHWDVFMYDKETTTTKIVSAASDGTLANNDSNNPTISSDGRYIAFESFATNLVANDTNSTRDVFVQDTQTGSITRVSVASDGTQSNGFSDGARISSDGRYVVFQSNATNLASDDTTNNIDVFIHDMQTGTTKRVSVASDGTETNGLSLNAMISSNNRYISFESSATNLVSDDTNACYDIFVYDMQTGETKRVSITTNGLQGDDLSKSASINTDGRYVTFQSNASNLVPEDTNGNTDVFVHDMQTGVTKRISMATDGSQSNGLSADAKISPDGRYIAFDSNSTNLVSGDTNGVVDVFVHDMKTGTTKRVSVSEDGTQGDNESIYPIISKSGKCVLYDSAATNLVSNDTNGKFDVYECTTGSGISSETNANLSGLALSSGTLSPTFAADTTSYTASVDGNTSSIMITPNVEDSGATVKINGTAVTAGSPSQAINLSSGTNTITVEVTAADGSTTMTYTIIVTKESSDNANLSGLALSSGTLSPTFAAGTTSYTASVDEGTSSIMITPNVEDSGATVKINGTAVTVGSASQAINLSSGTNTITVEVTAADGSTTKAYTINVNVVSPDIWSASSLVSTRVSVSSDGAEGNNTSTTSSVSADGRYVAFASSASNLVDSDTNGVDDVFVRDTKLGTTTRISVASDGTQANNSSSSYISISADGCYVVFSSDASNLVSADTNEHADLFLHDMKTGETKRISVANDGTERNAGFYFSAISADGRYVAFLSEFDLTTSNTTTAYCVMMYDNQTGTVKKIVQCNNSSMYAGQAISISGDGRYIAFQSDATDLITGDTNGWSDIYVCDTQSNTIKRISVASDGTQGDNSSYSPVISSDGQYVIYNSQATNLVTGDTNGSSDVFVYNMQTGKTERVSISSDGTQGDSNSMYQSISGDGRYIAFSSTATNLVTGDTNEGFDVFVHDRITGITRKISVASDGTQGNSMSAFPSISTEGKSVSYASVSNNLVEGDTNNMADVILTSVPSDDANLGGLTLSQGTLSPTFSAGTADYTANVDANTSSITVTPTVEDAGATVTVNGVAVTAGNSSPEISLSTGTNTISIVVTAANGAIKTYTIVANKLSSSGYSMTVNVGSISKYNEAAVKIMDNSGTVIYALNPGSDGLLTTPVLPVGTYTVECSKDGFLKTTITNVKIVDKNISLSAVTLTPGDVDVSGMINAVDIAIMKKNFNVAEGNVKYSTSCDFNRDGKINSTDYSLMTININKIDTVINYES